MTRMPQVFNIMQLQLAVLIAFLAQHLASSTACSQLHAAQVHSHRRDLVLRADKDACAGYGSRGDSMSLM